MVYTQVDAGTGVILQEVFEEPPHMDGYVVLVTDDIVGVDVDIFDSEGELIHTIRKLPGNPTPEQITEMAIQSATRILIEHNAEGSVARRKILSFIQRTAVTAGYKKEVEDILNYLDAPIQIWVSTGDTSELVRRMTTTTRKTLRASLDRPYNGGTVQSAFLSALEKLTS
jgi:hypothetical protein